MPFSTKLIMPYLPFSTKFIMPYLPFSTIFQQFFTQSRLIETIQVFPTVRERCSIADGLNLQCGAFTFACYGKRPKSNLIKKIESCDRDIYKKYISHHLYKGKHRTCQRKGLRLWYISHHFYKGKPIPGIERRRKKRVSIAVYTLAVI